MKQRGAKRTTRLRVGVAAVAVLSIALAACSSSGSKGSAPNGSGGGSGLQPPTRNMPVLQSIGKGEGKLNLIVWEGYTEPQWVKPFEQQTGCQVNAKYAGTS